MEFLKAFILVLGFGVLLFAAVVAATWGVSKWLDRRDKKARAAMRRHRALRRRRRG
jgi:hypothetical protein